MQTRLAWLFFLFLFFTLPVAAGAGQTGAKISSTPSGVIVDINGPIGPAISSYVVKAINQANTDKAALIILRIDTPGGLDSAMRDIIKAILNSPVPVVGFVAPAGARAASAGTYILYACHLAAMAPATNLGAATPIPITAVPTATPLAPKPAPSQAPAPDSDNAKAQQPAPQTPAHPAAEAAPGDAAQHKVVNDAVAYIRSLAELRGRNADWAEQAVRGGESLSAEQALKQQVVDLVAEDMPALLAAIDGRILEAGGNKLQLHTGSLQLHSITPNWRTRLLIILTNPSMAYILMMIGIYGLILEGYNPGAILPGVLGGICLLLAMFAFQLLPVNYTGLALIFLGLALMMAEAFVPSFGTLGLGGIAAFVFGSVMLMDSDVPGYQVPLGMVSALALGGALAISATVVLLIRARQRVAAIGAETIVGANAQAVADFQPDKLGYTGSVWLAGEIWQARSDQLLRKGQRATVRAREGLVVRVTSG